MLAARDQENLVHGHQQAAAAKPLNQSNRQLAPKTPGNKFPKTPLKVPLNDENGFGGQGGGKFGQRTNVKGNENLITGGKKMGLTDKNAFVTPMGPRNRAPLGLKTTNAKTKVFQTPAPPGDDNDLDKSNQKTLSARKPKPKVHQAEMTKLDVSSDKDELGEPEIEYMPPRAKNLPDYPDDIHELNLSMFKDGGLTRGAFDYYLNRPSEWDGLSPLERQEKEREEAEELSHKVANAQLLRDFESAPIPCFHEPECQGKECIASAESRKEAEGKYQKTMALLVPETALKQGSSRNVAPSKAPSTLTSKTAAAALSQANKPTATTVPPKAKKPLSTTTITAKTPSILAPRSKKPLTPAPTNPSTMRHASAIAASRTTIGHAAGRAASANMQKTVLSSNPNPNPDPKNINAAKKPLASKTTNTQVPDTTLAPAVYIKKYGVPSVGSEMWLRCKTAGCFDEEVGDEGLLGGADVGDWLREEAEREWRFEL